MKAEVGVACPLAPAPPAAPLPRRSELEAFRYSRRHGLATMVRWSVSAFLLRTPGGDPPAPGGQSPLANAACNKNPSDNVTENEISRLKSHADTASIIVAIKQANRAILPGHPFDVLYTYGFRYVVHGPPSNAKGAKAHKINAELRAVPIAVHTMQIAGDRRSQ